MPATAPPIPLRIDAIDVRAKVVGEGANLGFTQLGRIEAALAGRMIKHRRARQFGRRRHPRTTRVNIKIVTGQAITGGALAAATAMRCCSA